MARTTDRSAARDRIRRLILLRLRRVLDAIRGSRPAPDFRFRPVAPRLRRFLWEVMAAG